jgi:hypothetical protein
MTTIACPPRGKVASFQPATSEREDCERAPGDIKAAWLQSGMAPGRELSGVPTLGMHCRPSEEPMSNTRRLTAAPIRIPEKQEHLGPLTFVCPATHGSGLTGINTDVRTLRKFWLKHIKVKCDHCGEVHSIGVRDAFLSGALNAATQQPLNSFDL